MANSRTWTEHVLGLFSPPPTVQDVGMRGSIVGAPVFSPSPIQFERESTYELIITEGGKNVTPFSISLRLVLKLL